MINVSNNYKQALTQPRTIDAKITYDSTTINIDNINSIKRSFNSTLFKTIAKQVIIDSNISIDKDKTINPQFGLYLDNQFEYVSLGSYKTKNAPNLNKDTNSYEITAYDKIVDSMVDYGLTNSDITYPCSVRQLFVAIFTKLGWSTSGIPSTFVNSTSQIEEDVYSNVNFTYRDVLDELCTISCMFLIDVNGTPTLKQKTTTSETINEDFMSDKNVQIKNQVFFNSLVFSRASNSDNIYRKDDTSIANNGLHEFKVSDLQILSLNWRDNFIDAMWNYIKTFTYYAYEVNTGGITYLEPIDTFTLSTFGSTYSTILLNSDLTIANGVNEKIYANEPLESETEYKYADTTDKRINQTNLIVDKQNGRIDAVVNQVDEIEQDLQNPTSTKEDKYFDLEDALDSPLIDFSLYGDTQQDSTTQGKNLFDGTMEQGTFDTSGINQSSNTRIRSKKYISVSANTQYTIQGVNNTQNTMQYSISYYDKNDYTTARLSFLTWTTNNPLTFTTPNNCKYVRFLISFNNSANITPTNISNIQLEKGSSATSYESFIPNSPSPDYPQPIHNVSGDNTIEICGKNLFKEWHSGYMNTTTHQPTTGSRNITDYIQVRPSTKYTFWREDTGFASYAYEYDANYNYLEAHTITSDYTTISFTTKANTKYVILYQYIDYAPTNKAQLEVGESHTTYEPYTGNSQLISLGVENLFDYSTNIIESAVFNNSTMKIVSDNNCKLSYCKCLPNTTYTISRRNPIAQRFHIATTETTPQLNSNILSFDYNNSATSITITTPSNAHYIVVRFIYNETNDYETYAKTIQIEKGSKANSYSEYGKPYIELNKISTYQDYIYKDNDRWFHHKEIGKVVLDGTENWGIATNANFQAFTLNGAVSTGSLVGFSNYYKNFANSDWNYMQNNDFIVGRNNNQIIIRNDNISTTSDFETWLSTHNTIVNYVLAEPIDIPIEDWSGE